jgi:K+-transporting ATPase ATPase B chain
LALRGVRFHVETAESLFSRNLWVYGVGGLVAPFVEHFLMLGGKTF